MDNNLTAAELRAEAMRGRGITPATMRKTATIIHEVSPAGSLEARYPARKGMGAQVISLSFLNPLSNLRLPLAHATALHGGPVERFQTRERIASSLRQGFTRFLVSTKKTGIAIGEIRNETLWAFKQWLDECKTKDGEPLSEATRRMWFADFQILLKAMKSDKTWRSSLHPKLVLIKNPYPGSYNKHKPTLPLTDEQLENVFRTASESVIEFMRDTTQLLDDMEAAPGASEWPDTLDPTFAHAVNTLWERYGTALPAWQDLRDADERLALMLAGNYVRVCAALIPTAPTIAPFAILFALYFRYNHSTLFGAKRTDFSIKKFLGKERVLAQAYKPRSRKRQFGAIPATDDLDNPAVLLTFMDRWMKRARDKAPKEARRHLFICRASREEGYVRNLERRDSLEIFGTYCKQTGLSGVGMRVLRATGLDVVHDIFKGDFLAIMAASGQKNPQTFVSHYSNGGVRLRNEEALAQAMVLKERWEASMGVIDPRVNRGDDRAAATPGFICLDPFASPFPEQADKPICSAYGMCPMCPMAIVMKNSGYAYAQLLLLKDAIERTIEDVSTLARWGPVADRLDDYWLRVFTESAKESAETTYSDLPTLPKVN